MIREVSALKVQWKSHKTIMFCLVTLSVFIFYCVFLLCVFYDLVMDICILL